MYPDLEPIEVKLLKPLDAELATKVYERLNSAERVRQYVHSRFEGIFLVPLLERLLEQVPGSVLSRGIRENLMEEQGQIAMYGAEDHEACRAQLAHSIGVELAPYVPTDIEGLLKSASVHYLLGILYYIEYQVPSEYSVLLKRIKEFFEVTADDVYHLTNHIEHDEYHFDEISVRLSVAKNLDIDQFKAGIGFMHDRRVKLLNTCL